jgi:hypothetical protein
VHRFPSRQSAPPAACTLVRAAFRQSTDRRPVSIARMVQRRAAVQNALRCARQQNLWAEPPVVRRLKARPHQRQWTCSADCVAEFRMSAGCLSSATPSRASAEVGVIEIEARSELISIAAFYKISRIERSPRRQKLSNDALLRSVSLVVRGRGALASSGPICDGTMRRSYSRRLRFWVRVRFRREVTGRCLVTIEWVL